MFKESLRHFHKDLAVTCIQLDHHHELRKIALRNKEKEGFQPIHIVYEPIGNENELVICYFTDEIHLAYRSYVSAKKKGGGKNLL